LQPASAQMPTAAATANVQLLYVLVTMSSPAWKGLGDDSFSFAANECWTARSGRARGHDADASSDATDRGITPPCGARDRGLPKLSASAHRSMLRHWGRCACTT